MTDQLFKRKQHLFTLDPVTVTVPTVVGTLRSSGTRHMSVRSMLLLKNADLSIVAGYFQRWRVLTGGYPANVLSSLTSAVDGGMDEGLGASVALNIGGTGDQDASFEGTCANDTAAALLLLDSYEIPTTSRVHASTVPTGRKIYQGASTKTPSTGWVDMISFPLAAGQVMGIRAMLHANEGGSIGGCRWMVVAKNVGGTVTIVGDSRDSGSTYYDYAYNTYGITTNPRAIAGTNAVKLQCNGNSGAVIYSLAVEAAVAL